MEKQKLKGMVFAALFAALTGAVAWFKIPLPFTPVPITLQTLLVLMSGAMLGAYYGALAMIIYLVLGAIGFPVFAGGSSGIAALFGPSGGYLFSYPLAAYMIGLLTAKKEIREKYSIKSTFNDFMLFIIGLLVSAVLISLFILIVKLLHIMPGLVFSITPTAIANVNFLKLIGIFILSYFIVGFVTGEIQGKNKLKSFFKYFSFNVIISFIILVAVDSLFKIGFLKLGNKTMVSVLSEQQRIILVTVSLIVLALFLLLIYYIKKSKSFSLDVVLAMFAGTLIIYFLGAIQGKFATGLPWSAIFVGWVLPFIIGDTLKLIVAAWVANKVDAKKYMK